MRFCIRVFTFDMVFLFSGAALAPCVPTFGAFLFWAWWLPVRSSWLGWLWARRVWSGRLGPGIILVVFLGRLFGARNGHTGSAEMQKQIGLGLFMRKERLAESLHASLSVPKAAVFSSVFRILAGTFWFKMRSLVPNSALHSVFLVFCSVPFLGLFWVLLTGWSAGWPLCGLN